MRRYTIAFSVALIYLLFVNDLSGAFGADKVQLLRLKNTVNASVYDIDSPVVPVHFEKNKDFYYCDINLFSNHIDVSSPRYSKNIHIEKLKFADFKPVKKSERGYIFRLYIKKETRNNFYIVIRKKHRYFAQIHPLFDNSNPARSTSHSTIVSEVKAPNDIESRNDAPSTEQEASAIELENDPPSFPRDVEEKHKGELEYIPPSEPEKPEDGGVLASPALSLLLVPLIVSLLANLLCSNIAINRYRYCIYYITGVIGRSKKIISRLEEQSKDCERDIQYGLTDKISFKPRKNATKGFITPTFDKFKYNYFICSIFSSCINGDMPTPFYLISGKAGQGKSTLLRKMCIDFTETYIKKKIPDQFKCSISNSDIDRFEAIPVFISLKNLELYLSTRETPSICTCIQDYIIEEKLKLKCDSKRYVSNYWFSNKRMILLFDGIDEIVPSYRKTIIRAIKEIYKTGQVAIILTSRPVSEVYNIEEYYLKRIAIDNCESNEIDGYIYSSFYEPRRGDIVDRRSSIDGESFLSTYSENAGVISLLQNPFHVTMLLFLYYEDNIEGNEMEMDFYAKTVDKLNTIRTSNILNDLDLGSLGGMSLNRLYRDIALEFYKAGRVETNIIEQKYLCTLFEEYAPVGIEVNRFIKVLCDQSGIIGKSGVDIEFVHKSFLEYFLGLGLSEQVEKFRITEFNKGEMLTTAKSYFSSLSKEKKHDIISKLPEKTDRSDLLLSDMLPYAYIQYNWDELLTNKKIYRIKSDDISTLEHVSVLGDMLLNINESHFTEGLLTVLAQVSMAEQNSKEIRQLALETYFRYSLFRDVDHILSNHYKIDTFIIDLTKPDQIIACKAIAGLRLGGIEFMVDFIDRMIKRYLKNHDPNMPYSHETRTEAESQFIKEFQVVRILQETVIQYNEHTSTLFLDRLYKEIHEYASKNKKFSLDEQHKFIELVKNARLIEGIKKYCNDPHVISTYNYIVEDLTKLTNLQDDLIDLVKLFFMIPEVVLANHTSSPDYYLNKYRKFYSFCGTSVGLIESAPTEKSND